MGIETSINEKHPEVLFNKVHVLHINIDQPIFYDNALQPQYNVFISYKLYGLHNSQRYYHSDVYEIEIKDFMSVAMLDIEKGNFDKIQVLQAIEKAIAGIIKEDQAIETKVI